MVLLTDDGTRILRPSEFDAIVRGSKASRLPGSREYHILLKVLLYSGLHYSEAQLFQRHPSWFANGSIHVVVATGDAPDRFIKLPPKALDPLSHFFKARRLPSRNAWVKNLRHWAKAGGIPDEGLNVKTARKTWVAWLLTTYEQKENREAILDTFGNIQFNFTDRISFTPADKQAIRWHTERWL